MIELPESEHAADRTRDCLDPWKMALVKADGSVALCCWGENVGNIHDTDLDTVLRSPRASDRRMRLLSGRLGSDCLACPARGWTSTSALRDRLAGYLDTERELTALRGHARTLEDELAQLKPHAATLEDQLSQLTPHAQSLEAELTRWKAHATTLAAELGHLRPHAATLAHALSTGVPGWWRRMTGPAKRLLRGSSGAEKPSIPAPRPAPIPAPIPAPKSVLMRGCVESLRFGYGRCELGGWAFSIDESFDELRLHVDGRDVGPLERMDRGDVAAEFRHLPRAIRSGFSASLACPPSTRAWRNVRVVGARAGVEVAYLELDVPTDPRVLGPIPPEHLMDRVAHITNPDLFRLDGLRAATEVASVLARHGASEPARLLDWGCGCGRVLPVLRARWPRAHVVGVDVDREAIAWMRGAHADVELEPIDFDPPAPFTARDFDVIIGLSVMTHLDRARQVAWLEELTSRLAPNGLLVLSVHGPMAARITGMTGVQHELAESGVSDSTNDVTLNGVLAAGEYRATFQTEVWTRANWRGELEVVDWIVGGLGGFQDLVVLRRTRSS